MSQIQRTVVFSGRVQGVGFRMTAVHFAKGLAVWGTVKNLADGGVELVASGKAADVEMLVRRLVEHFDAEIRTDQKAVAEPGAAGGIRIIY